MSNILWFQLLNLSHITTNWTSSGFDFKSNKIKHLKTVILDPQSCESKIIANVSIIFCSLSFNLLTFVSVFVAFAALIKTIINRSSSISCVLLVDISVNWITLARGQKQDIWGHFEDQTTNRSICKVIIGSGQKWSSWPLRLVGNPSASVQRDQVGRCSHDPVSAASVKWGQGLMAHFTAAHKNSSRHVNTEMCRT